MPGHDGKSGTGPRSYAHRSFPTYDELYRNFPLGTIPERFNMATACCDRHADGTNRLALIYVDEDGCCDPHPRSTRVAEMSRPLCQWCFDADGPCARATASRCFLFAVAGIAGRGHLAAFRSGMISIPLCRAVRRRRTIEFPAVEFPAPGPIVTDESGWGKTLHKIRDRLPDLSKRPNGHRPTARPAAGTKPFLGQRFKGPPSPDFYHRR